MNAHSVTAQTAAVSPVSQPVQTLAPADAAPKAEPSATALAYKAAMRKLAGAVSILTVGAGESRTGLTATSVSSLSIDPPTLLICVNRSASAFGALKAHGTFAINVLRPQHQPLANQFAGVGGLKGAARFQGAEWIRLETGAPVLADALAAFDCEIEEAIERHSHVIVIGRVVASRITETAEPLLYWAGAYRNIGA